jgi:hypothetical protein
MEKFLLILVVIALILALGAQIFLGNEIISPIMQKKIIVGAVILVPVGTLAVYLYGKLIEKDN